MTKAELVKRITLAAEGNLTRRESERLADAVFDEIAAAIARDGKFTWPGFGTWTATQRRERRAHNPRTHEAMRVPAGRSVRFRTAPTLELAVAASTGSPKVG